MLVPRYMVSNYEHNSKATQKLTAVTEQKSSNSYFAKDFQEV